MASYERDTTPLSPWAYFGLNFLYAIPVLGFIMLIIHAVSAPNVNKRNFARSYFCWVIILLVAIVAIVISGSAASVISWLSNLIG